ncbi:MAG: YfaP family protein [Desulfuromonadales bacterium]
MSLILFLLTGLHVEDGHATICDLKTYVFYGNGMFNNQNVADKSLVELDDKVRIAGNLSDDEWAFELSYNHDEGLYSLFEVYRQSMGDQAAAFWRWLGSSEVAPDWFQSAAREIATSYDLAESLIDADLRRHVQRYESLLMEGNRILVVAHSQGNLYANSAYANLAAGGRTSMDAFGIVSVATPATHVAGNGPYYTLNYDLVISAVQMALPGTLPGNVVNTVSDRDWAHHSFIDSYLSGDQTGPLIVNSALNNANALSWPEPQVGNGPISVTLTWGAEPDVDLHVYEPDGTHVYYGNRLGSSGYLDRDDISAFGPEHYYVVDCETLAAGTYRVGVNYFWGRAPETAHVQIKAGDIVRDYSIGLPSPEGSAGNSNPEAVASIKVIGDADAGYEFNVESLH